MQLPDRKANDWSDLVDGSIQNPLNQTESGGTPANQAWTGTTPAGNLVGSETCSGETLVSRPGKVTFIFGRLLRVTRSEISSC